MKKEPTMVNHEVKIGRIVEYCELVDPGSGLWILEKFTVLIPSASNR